MSRTSRDAQGKEHENFGPNVGWLSKRVDAKCFKRSQDDENGCPPMIERERQVNEYFVTSVRGCVILLHDVVDVLWENMKRTLSLQSEKTHGDSAAHEQCKNKSDHIVVRRP